MRIEESRDSPADFLNLIVHQRSDLLLVSRVRSCSKVRSSDSPGVLASLKLVICVQRQLRESIKWGDLVSEGILR